MLAKPAIVKNQNRISKSLRCGRRRTLKSPILIQNDTSPRSVAHPIVVADRVSPRNGVLRRKPGKICESCVRCEVHKVSPLRSERVSAGAAIWGRGYHRRRVLRRTAKAWGSAATLSLLLLTVIDVKSQVKTLKFVKINFKP